MTVVDEARSLIENALKEIDQERKRLEKALSQLGKDVGKKRPGRPKGSGKGSTAKRGRRKGSNRADQAVKIIQKEPGITASEIAKKMKIKANYLYRVLGGLEKEGRVKKDGRKYRPV